MEPYTLARIGLAVIWTLLVTRVINVGWKDKDMKFADAAVLTIVYLIGLGGIEMGILLFIQTHIFP